MILLRSVQDRAGSPAVLSRALRIIRDASRAGQLRQSTGSATAQCIAAAAVEVINRGSGGRKLPGWWRNDQ